MYCIARRCVLPCPGYFSYPCSFANGYEKWPGQVDQENLLASRKGAVTS